MDVEKIKAEIAECDDAEAIREVADAASDRCDKLAAAEAPPKNQRFQADPAAEANPGEPVKKRRKK